MADITPTPANVIAPNANTSIRIAGETITAGAFVYIDTTDSDKVKLAQADGTLLQANVYGVAAEGATAGQPIVIVISGDITYGTAAFIGAGVPFVLSATAGKMCLDADLVNTNYLTKIGHSISTTVLRLGILPTGMVCAGRS